MRKFEVHPQHADATDESLGENKSQRPPCAIAFGANRDARNADGQTVFGFRKLTRLIWSVMRQKEWLEKSPVWCWK